MGTNTNQIATEANTESSYGTYISSTTTNKKCITVKRLLEGLLETSNTPSYVASDFSSGYTNKYNIKTWGSSPATVVNISDGSNFYNSNTSQIIETTANNYGAYPFSTGTAFLSILGNKTVTGEVVFTYGKRQVSVNALSTDGVSPASMDFDNPEEDTELNNDGQEPTVAGNMSRATTIPGCTQANPCVGLDGSCVANETPGGCPLHCPSQNCWTDQCLTENKPPCSCQTEEEITHPPFSFKPIYLYLQIYNGVDSQGNDTYRSILDISRGSGFSCSIGKINHSTTQTFSINIPTGTVFPISGSPTGAFKFRIYGNFGNDFDPAKFTDGLYVSAQITVNMPKINFVVYNPGPKCIKYSDLPTVYKLYGKTV